jgi:hypothetical protein
MMYCEICGVKAESQAPWLDHLAGKRHRQALFRMKAEPLIVDDEEKLEESFPKVKLEEAAQILQSLKGHITQAQCRLSSAVAAAIFLVLFVISSTLWIVGVRAETGAEMPSSWNSWCWIPLYLIVGWQLGKVVTWIKTSCENFVVNLNQRVTSIERSVANVGVNIEQQVQNAGIQIQLSVEQKIAEVEAKVSNFAAPAIASAKSGVNIAAMIALVGAVYYLCRSLFVRHAEKKESLEKLTSSKVFKLFDCLALTVIVPMMLYNGLSFAYDMWRQVKLISQMASSACSGVSILSSLFGGSETAPVMEMDHVKFVQASVEQLTQSIDKKLDERKQGKDDEKSDSESLPLTAELNLDTPADKRKAWMEKVQLEMAARFPTDPRYAEMAKPTPASAPRLPGDTRGLGAPVATEAPKPVVPPTAFDALREYWNQTEDLVHLNALKKQCTEQPWLLPVVMICLFAVLLLVVKVLHKTERKSRKKEKSKAKAEKAEAKTQQPRKNASKKKPKGENKPEKKESQDGCCHVTVGKHKCPWFLAKHPISVSAKKCCNIHCGGLKCMHWAECDPPGYPSLTLMPASEASECVHQPNQVKCKKCGWSYEGNNSKQRRAAARKGKVQKPKPYANYNKPGEDVTAIWTRDNGGNLVKTKDLDQFVVPSNFPHAGLLNDFMHGSNESAQRGAAKKLLAAVSKVKKDLDKKHPKGKCSVCGAEGHVGKSCPNKGSQPCYYFKKGNCKNGDKCEFLHKSKDVQESAINGKRFSLGKVQGAVGLARIGTRCLNANLMWNGIVVCEHIFKEESDSIKFSFRHDGKIVEHSTSRSAGRKLGYDLLWFARPDSFKEFPHLYHSMPVPGRKVALYAYDSDEQFMKSDISWDASKIIRIEDVCDSMSLTCVTKHKVGIYKLSSIDGNCSGVVVDAESGKVVGFHNATRGGVENVFLAITPQIVAAATAQPQKN